MSMVYCYSYTEEIPTLDAVNDEISNIVGLSEIKSHLMAILEKIIAAERSADLGLRVVPPRPFHMVFLGNPGTGKSTVARIMGKLFYLAGALPSYEVTEMQGSSQSVKQVKEVNGGVLLVDVNKQELNHKVSKRIMSAMDGGKTAVVFAGQRKGINQCMSMNKELYKRFSVTLCFNDLTCEELATILEAKMNNHAAEEDNMCGLKLHPSCCVDVVTKLIAKWTSEKQRKKINAHLVDDLVDQVLLGAKSKLEGGTGFEVDVNDIDRNTITLLDLEAGLGKSSF